MEKLCGFDKVVQGVDKHCSVVDKVVQGVDKRCVGVDKTRKKPSEIFVE